MSAPVTLLFTDLANSADLLQRAGGELVQRVFQAHHRLLTRFVVAHGGQDPRWLGDGWLTAFASPADAMRCAAALQLAARRRAAAARLPTRVGLHLGDRLREETDYFSTPVMIARRLCGAARAGQVLCSATVGAMLADTVTMRNGPAVGVGSAGPLRVASLHGAKSDRLLGIEGVAEPVSACEVVYQQDQPLALLKYTPFVGRSTELARLTARLQDAQAGSGGLVMLAGEPGIGKTRTLEELAELARMEGALVLWGRCYEGEAARPYGPFVEALAEHARTAEPDSLRADLGLGAAPLARLVPAIRERFSDISEPVALQPDEERVRLLDAVAQLLVTLSARAPVVLVLDDLHWADTATVALLRHVARIASRHRLLVLGSYRDVEVAAQQPLADALGALPRETTYEHLALTGLESSDVEDLLEAVADQKAPGALVAAITAETSGNPFFIREVLLHLIEEKRIGWHEGQWIANLSVEQMGIPHGVRQVIQRRLTRLSAGANRLLRAAAGFSGSFHFDIAARVAGLGEAEALDAVDEALAAQLLRSVPESETFDFSHALVRYALYAELSPPRRVRLHRQVAEALEEVSRDRAEEHAGEIAQHYHRSATLPGAERGVTFALLAANQAERSFAFADATVYLRLALDLVSKSDPRRPRLLAQCGRNLALAQEGERALAVIREAVPLLEQTEGQAAAAEYLAGLLDPLFEAGFYTAAFAVAYMGRAYVGTRHDRIWASFAAMATIEREFADEQHPGIAIDSPERREIGEIFLELTPAAPSYAWTFIRRDRRLADADLGADVYWRGSYRPSLPRLYERGAQFEHHGLIALAVDTWATIARCHIALGEFALAREGLAHSARLAERVPGSNRRVMTIAAEDELRAALDEGWDAQLQVPVMPPTRQLPWYRATTAAAMARTHARMGRVERALHRLGSVVPAIECAPGWMENYTRIAYSAAETLWLTGHTDHVGTIERNLRTQVVTPDYRYPMTDGRLALARICALQGRDDEALEWFAKARVVLDEQGARPLRAIVDYDEALMYHRRAAAGDTERAQPLLDAALQQFRALGMPGWITRAEALRTPCVAATSGTSPQQSATCNPAGSAVIGMPRNGELAEGVLQSVTPIVPAAAPPEPNVFRRDGHYWTLAYGGQVVRLKDSKGLRNIACLLASPGNEVHVAELASEANGIHSVSPPPIGDEQLTRAGLEALGAGCEPALDAQARQAYRARVVELRADLEEAERHNDRGRAERARAEMDAIATALASAYGLCGRGRTPGGALERARVAVAMRIRNALAKIENEHRTLGRHLLRSIKTGTFCSYQPEAQVHWHL